MKKPKIELPDLTKGSGMVRRNGIYFARYFVGKTEKRITLKTASPEVAEQYRDRLFALMTIEGATTVKTKTPKQKVLKKASMYIYERKPFVVRVGNKIVAEVDTRKEAEKVRDNYLKLKP